MIFDLDSRWMEILNKVPTVDTSKMYLPPGIKCIYDARNLSNEDRMIVTANNFIIRLKNDKAVVIDCSLDQLEMWINTILIDDIVKALNKEYELRNERYQSVN